MARETKHAAFSDKQLSEFATGKYTGLVKRLAAELTNLRRTKNGDDPEKIAAVERDRDRLLAELRALAVSNPKQIQEDKTRLKPDPNNCCPQHGRRWFNRIGSDCVCLRCHKTWEATE